MEPRTIFVNIKKITDTRKKRERGHEIRKRRNND